MNELPTSELVRRVVVVVLDGLRPDAIDAFDLEHVQRLRRMGAYTMQAQTVAPSVTACVMTSLFTGATPEWHGMQSDKFRIPQSRGPLHPIPKVIAAYGYPSAGHVGRLPFFLRGFGHRIARMLGLGVSGFHAGESRGILAGALDSIDTQESGFIILHWPDADRIGHVHGWMSREYGDAARGMDRALGELMSRLDLGFDSETLLIAIADHGGGGLTRNDHDSPHPLDRTIPIILAGGSVVTGPISGPVSLLDVPATVLWALGVPLPSTYAGTPIVTAFTKALAVA